MTSHARCSPICCVQFFRKCAFSHKDMHPFTRAFDTLSEIRFYTHTCTKKIIPLSKTGKKAIYRLILYTTYGRAPRTWRHKIKTLKSNNFLFLWPIFVKPSLICFFHLPLFIETKIISGWTSPLTYWCRGIERCTYKQWKDINMHQKWNSF